MLNLNIFSNFLYYEIVQQMPYINKTVYNKIDNTIQNPLDLIKPLVNLMVGDIKVYRYYSDGSFKKVPKFISLKTSVIVFFNTPFITVWIVFQVL